MSAPALPPIIELYISEMASGAETARHAREGFDAEQGVWEAQADAIASRIVQKLDETLAAEVTAILADNPAACLHKVAGVFIDLPRRYDAYFKTLLALLGVDPEEAGK